MPSRSSVLEVDLRALANNWRLVRDAVAPALCGAVVKADAYGLGAMAAAEQLFRSGCRDFFVAHVDEGVALRDRLTAGAAHTLLSSERLRIYVFEGPRPDSLAMLLDSNLTPIINSLEQLNLWLTGAPHEAARKLALHFDTGMARLGLADADAEQLFELLGRTRRAQVELLMTHLACADVAAHPLTTLQLERFARIAARFPGATTSIGNSAGALSGRDTCGGMARPGIVLYGCNPFSDGRANPAQQVANWRAEVLQVRQLARGNSVGYGADWRADRPSLVATLGVGYADGYPRALSNRGWVTHDGRRFSVIGRITMDLITVDVTDAAPAIVPGMWLNLLGDGVDVDALAAAAGTVGYEILTRIGGRVPRRYRL